MKRFTAFFLVWIMIFSLAVPVLAVGEDVIAAPEQDGQSTPAPEEDIAPQDMGDGAPEPPTDSQPPAGADPANPAEPQTDPPLQGDESSGPSLSDDSGSGDGITPPADSPDGESGSPSPDQEESGDPNANPDLSGEDGGNLPSTGEGQPPADGSEPPADSEGEGEPTTPPDGDPAAPEGGEPESEEEENIDQNQGEVVYVEKTSPASSLGQIDISISSAVRLLYTPSFTVSITGPHGDSMTVPADKTVYSFTDLPTGVYQLSIQAPGFVPFTQEVSLGAGSGAELQYTIGQLVGVGEKHPGVLQLGDLDGSGAVDGSDWESMKNALSGNGACDLNGDGITNLVDAEYLARSMDLSGLDPNARISHIAQYVLPTALGVSAAQDTTVSENVSSLFQKENTTPVTLSKESPISPEAPLDLALSVADAAVKEVQFKGTNISSGTFTVETGDNTAIVFSLGNAAAPAADSASTISTISAYSLIGSQQATRDAQGNIVLDLGGQTAVKKVKIHITGTTEQSTLASMTQVEFLNGMEERIPEPQVSVPQNVYPTAGNRQFTVTWSPCQNITGYEVLISANGSSESYSLTGTSLTVMNFGGKEVENYTTYSIQVQSVNGSWESGWSGAVTVTPVPSGKPDKPDNVEAEGGYRKITVKWKKMLDTTSYHLYYREAGTEAYQEVKDIKGNSYIINDLPAEPKTYEIDVAGVNELGEGARASVTTSTISLDPVEMPKYNLINQDGANNPGSNHIASATACRGTGFTHGNEADAGTANAWATVDGDPGSYYQVETWDDGGYNYFSDKVGLKYTFDQAYEMDTIGMCSSEAKMDYTYVKVRCWDESGTQEEFGLDIMRTEARTDPSGKTYYFLRLPKAMKVQSIQIGAARAWAGNNLMNISEVYFYAYDDLKRQIYDLYEDSLHTMLKESVTEELLNTLEQEIENKSVDQFGNVNPDLDLLREELKTAKEIYQDQFLRKVTQVHTGITGWGDEHGFTGLNAWQPLGITAAAGEKITVYVGSNKGVRGTNTNLKLIVTQFHAESGAMSMALKSNLKVGPNEVTVPRISSMNTESGGALYVEYTGGAGSKEEYAVRVSGGVAVPVLDLYGVPEGERAARVSAYVSELSAYASTMEAKHAEVHQSTEEPLQWVNYPYDAQNCILGATDIMMDSMMLSLPVTQVLAGCQGNAGTLLNSLNAMENMMHLFYQHKGLNKNAPNAVDRIPFRHLNIRYQRMFSGAFMYAAGNHIGIEWNETAGMAGCGGVQTDGNGRYVSGAYFGWGIAHEIGHNINQGSYAIAEITNNYFSVLAQAQETNSSVRFDYANVYNKVTSGVKGSSANVFTQLAMYWQLHLAYDKGYNFKTYENYDEQLANLFFARVDTYARTPSRAPGEKKLSLEGADVDQTLMRLACAAAQKNLLDFFVRWGKTPDETTIEYASQFGKESRAIYYVNDESRAYTLSHGEASVLGENGDVSAIQSVKVEVDPNQANKVNISIEPGSTVPADAILGYEIVRCTIAAGVTQKQPVGFTTTNTFQDVVSAMNNRTVFYEVTLVDKYLNRSAVVKADMVKIQHEGDLSKDHWTITTEGLTSDPIVNTPDMDNPEIVETNPATLAIDNKVETSYSAVIEGTASITIDFHENQVMEGIRFTAGSGGALGSCSVNIRENGQWKKVSDVNLNATQTIYFANTDGNYVTSYQADALKLDLSATSGSISVAEIDVLGPTGDNVDIASVDGSIAVGYLSQAYNYVDGEEELSIPVGSLVFTGTYKGNAAYNVVILYDQDGNIVAGYNNKGEREANQIILAEIPAEGNIKDTREGIWVYWIEPDYLDYYLFKIPDKVRVELYRVDNALTNEGDRLVSDSLFMDIPDSIGNITINQSSAKMALISAPNPAW